MITIPLFCDEIKFLTIFLTLLSESSLEFSSVGCGTGGGGWYAACWFMYCPLCPTGGSFMSGMWCPWPVPSPTCAWVCWGGIFIWPGCGGSFSRATVGCVAVELVSISSYDNDMSPGCGLPSRVEIICGSDASGVENSSAVVIDFPQDFLNRFFHARKKNLV